MIDCKFPNCNCHFGYQEEGSDNCPMKDKGRTVDEYGRVIELGNTLCPKIGQHQWTCTYDECTCHLKERIPNGSKQQCETEHPSSLRGDNVQRQGDNENLFWASDYPS